MSARRNTPLGRGHSKELPSKFRSPSNFNSTFVERQDSASKFSKTKSSVRSQKCLSHLDVTGIERLPHGSPDIKTSLGSGITPFAQYEVECDLAYSDYLQALLKREIVGNVTEKFQEEIDDQLIIQKDKLYKSQLQCHNVKTELENLETLHELNEIVQVLEKSNVQFDALFGSFDLAGNLEKVVNLLNWACNQVTLKKIKLFNTVDDVKQLQTALQNCEKVLEKISSVDRNTKQVNHLAGVMKKNEETLQSLFDQQTTMDQIKDKEVNQLLKCISDKCAEWEKQQISFSHKK